jgi:hypothetical protein
MGYFDINDTHGITSTFSIPIAQSSYDVGVMNSGRLYTNNFGENADLDITYRPYAGDYNTYLNYIRINYIRTLKPSSEPVTLFRSVAVSDALRFNITSAGAQYLVWDVTSYSACRNIETALNGSTLSFVAANETPREYALIDLSKAIPSPTVLGAVENQNLHGLHNPELVIIARKAVMAQARRLAALHEAESGMRTSVVSAEQVYNEFSSGVPDATAYRRLMRMFYDRYTAGLGEAPKYLLLFGSGIYDNKGNITHTDFHTDPYSCRLLTFQSIHSLSETASFTSDDYFGFLDEEGTVWASATLDIGIGRLPVTTPAEAEIVVDKIERYINHSPQGEWQNTVMFIADDAVTGSASESEMDHIRFSDDYATTLRNSYPNVITHKIYEDAYPFTVIQPGRRSPETHDAIINTLNKGALILNYMGHGSIHDWTHESILTSSDVYALQNSILPFWVTGTCNFAAFDMFQMSGGELTLFNPRGGSIGIISSARTVYSSSNDLFVRALYKNMFALNQSMAPRLGDIMRSAKCENNLRNDDNKLRFLLFADPALQLHFPYCSDSVRITELNGIAVPASSTIQLSPLSPVHIKGKVTNYSQQVLSDFNGTVQIVLFDNEQSLTTLGNGANGVFDPKFNYTDYPNVLFSGKAVISGGEFEITITLPADILNRGAKGKITLTAYRDNGSKPAAAGFFTGFKVMNAAPAIPAENVPPTISAVYINEPSFVSGDTIQGGDAVFYATVSDVSGINLSGTLGRHIVLSLDGSGNYDITSSFRSSDHTACNGSLDFTLPSVSEGKHRLTFKIWDVWGNKSEQEVDFYYLDNDYSRSRFTFTVSQSEKAEQRYGLEFASLHLPSDRLLSLDFRIEASDGSVAWVHRRSDLCQNLRNYNLSQHELNSLGFVPEAGIYTCRLSISIDGKEVKTFAEKLAVGRE